MVSCWRLIVALARILLKRRHLLADSKTICLIETTFPPLPVDWCTCLVVNISGRRKSNAISGQHRHGNNTQLDNERGHKMNVNNVQLLNKSVYL